MKHLRRNEKTDRFRKYELSKTFGLITSASSNTVWASQGNNDTTLRSSGVGKAIVGADEEVLCWDIKKGELLGRWKDNDCTAEVTVVSQSQADPDVYAVGFV